MFTLDALPPLKELILGGPVPFIIALALAALLGRRQGLSLGLGLGVVVGYLVLHVTLNGWLLPGKVPSLAAVRVEHWLFWIVPLGLLAGWVAAPGKGLLALSAPVSLCAVTLGMIFYPKLKGFWTASEAAPWLALWSVLLLWSWHGMGSAARRTKSYETLLLTGASLGLASLVIGLTGSRKLAQMAGALSAAVFGSGVYSLLAKREASAAAESTRTALGPPLAGGLALMAIAHHYGSLNLDLALLVAAPWLLYPLLLRRSGSDTVVASLLTIGLALFPALVATGLAIARFEPPEEHGW